MDIIGYLIALAVVGLIVGALGRLIVPGPDPMGIFGTIAVGLVGSFAAGLLARAVWDSPAPGLILAVLVTALLVWLLRPRARAR